MSSVSMMQVIAAAGHFVTGAIKLHCSSDRELIACATWDRTLISFIEGLSADGLFDGVGNHG